MVIGHRRAVQRLSGVIVILLGLVAGARAAETVPVVVATADGEHLFRAEVADTTEERSRGLMFREELAPDAGMLFLFDPPRRVSFWMKNTYISLDMLFIDAAGRIVHIAERTEPESLDGHGPDQRVRAVLEINGGLADRLGIGPGDVVRAPPLAP
ncbi:MAG: DUF192 domain-containing protein [Deinococcus-Thermus bacterium]|nr:DUF192 domain-containing protein [Deinococcota bacterium]